MALKQGRLGLDDGFQYNILSGKKRGDPGRQDQKNIKIMAIVEGHDYPIAFYIDSASPGEATLVENTSEAKITDDLPPRLIGDKACDSDELDEKLAEKYQVKMIAPNRRNRCKTQDGKVVCVKFCKIA